MNEAPYVAVGLAILGIGFAASGLLGSSTGRYEFVGASPRGVVVFDSATGNTEVRAPFAAPPTTTTTEPTE